VRFGIQLARETGIVKKVLSLQEWPVARLMGEVGAAVPDGHTMVNTMIAAPFFEAFETLVAACGGTIVSNHAEGEGPYGLPLYEFTYGHGLKQIQKANSKYTGLQGLFAGSDVVGMIERVHRRFAGQMPIRAEIFWSQGDVVAMGSPAILYESEEQMAGLVRILQDEGVNIANSHTTGVLAVGIKQVDERDASFKAEMDPYNLLNPGKLEFGDGQSKPLDSSLPTSGWHFRKVG